MAKKKVSKPAGFSRKPNPSRKVPTNVSRLLRDRPYRERKRPKSKETFEELYQRAVEVFEVHRQALLKIPGVKGVDVGVKIVEGDDAGIPAIRIHVARKLNEGTAAHKGTLIKRTIDGVPTDVVKSGTFKSASVTGGGAIAPVSAPNASGTLGTDVRVRKGAARPVRFLTCQHVVTDNGRIGGTAIDMIEVTTGTTIGTSQSTDWIFDSEFDGALIEPHPSRNSLTGIPGGLLPIEGIRELTGDDVRKFVWMRAAKTDNISTGKIESITFNTTVDYGELKVPVINQIHITPIITKQFGLKGDSGGIVFIAGMAIGVLRAVDDKSGAALACPLFPLANKFNVISI